jgi:hypothetical protein
MDGAASAWAVQPQAHQAGAAANAELAVDADDVLMDRGRRQST